MSLEFALGEYPKDITLKNGTTCSLRPLEKADAKAFHEFFCAMPGQELMFLKHRVTDPETITGWCNHIDLGRNFPLLAVSNGKILGVATLHQQFGGWKRHIGRVSVQVHPNHRGHGLAQILITDLIEIARQCALEKIEAEFIEKQVNAIQMFGFLGFSELIRIPNYVKDMQAVSHDYILMGLDLITDEEYAGVG